MYQLLDFGGGRKLEKSQKDYADWLGFLDQYASCYAEQTQP